MSDIRLDKYLADAGKGTRSQVKILIRQGRVKIGDSTVKKPEQKINIHTDKIYLDGELLGYSEYEYYMLNKPQGVISATGDKQGKTVLDLITTDKRRDLFPVGRLDKDTEGLLIITNDGKTANDLLAPKKHVDKTYYAVISGNVTGDTISLFAKGLDIGDEEPTKPSIVKLVSPRITKEKIHAIINDAPKRTLNPSESNRIQKITHVEITITEGRYHQIKRMFQTVGMEVLYLKRLSMGSLVLDENLKCGEYRRLTDEEISLLKKA